MKRRADDLGDKLFSNCGVYISVSKLCKVLKLSRKAVIDKLDGVPTHGTGTGARYHYIDVANRFAER